MTEGDRMRQMSNKELAREIFRWHDILFGTEFRFAEDIERFLNKQVEPRNIHDDALAELWD